MSDHSVNFILRSALGLSFLLGLFISPLHILDSLFKFLR